MNEQQFATKHDLDLSAVNDENSGGIIGFIVRLYVILTNLVAKINEAKEAKSGGVKLAVALVEKDEDTVNATDALARDIRTLIFAAIEEDENIAVLLPNVLTTIRQEVVSYRDLVMSGLDIAEDSDDDDDNDVSDLKREAKVARDLITKMSTLVGMFGKSLGDLPAEMTKTNKAGETVLSLPQVRERNNEEGETTKGVRTSRWTFALNGEALPVTTVDAIAVRYCSTHTARINGAELKEMFANRTGKKFPEGPESGTVTIPVPKGELVLTLNTK